MVKRVLVLTVGLLLLAGPAWADAVADFYKGKTIRIVVGYGPGGTTDLTTRLIAPVLHKYIPGGPRIVVQNKAGGGSALAANTVFNNERRDGTVMAGISSSLVMKQARGVAGIKFDGRKFNWVASAFRANSACAVRTDAGVKSFADAVKTKKQLIVSSFDKGGLSHLEPIIFNAVFGANFKAVTGFPSGGAQRLAVKNGEVNGFCTTFQTMASTEIAMFEGAAKCCRVLIIAGATKEDHPLLKGVPAAEALAKEQGKSKDEIAMLRAMNATNQISIVHTLPPGVPMDRVEAMRDAFVKAYNDPQVQALAKKQNRNLQPRRGDGVAKIVGELLNTPKPLMDQLKALIAKG
ncbi:MAG: tripartite tricarboxylate transporter substrate-binding protein [Deltaproteobacteria bacterium]|nr:tripartite tricarboxylate transporter substrate-binding protein [Deltaproteobacteria bacterium]